MLWKDLVCFVCLKQCKLLCCELSRCWRLLALALSAIVVPLRLLSETVTGITSSKLLRK